MPKKRTRTPERFKKNEFKCINCGEKRERGRFVKTVEGFNVKVCKSVNCSRSVKIAPSIKFLLDFLPRKGRA